MYDLNALKRKIKKHGVIRTINELNDAKFSKDVMKQLEEANIYVDGVLNIAYIRSLSG